MTKIIVAIDFSDCSINAFLHALSIAQQCHSDIELIWVEKPENQQDKILEPVADHTGEVKSRFLELISRYQPDLPNNTITYKIRTGKVYREIAVAAKDEGAMLVVAGTHGASGFEEFWAGSNANKIVSACECPVITIRAGINIKRALHTIILPIDSTMETRQKATFTGYLAKHHDAEVHILKLYSTKVKAIRQNVDLYASQVARYFDNEGVKYKMEALETDNLSDTTIEYAKNVDANLISIMTDQESKTANLWMGPFAQQTVNHSPIPVLSIHSRNLMTIQTN